MGSYLPLWFHARLLLLLWLQLPFFGGTALVFERAAMAHQHQHQPGPSPRQQLAAPAEVEAEEAACRWGTLRFNGRGPERVCSVQGLG